MSSGETLSSLNASVAASCMTWHALLAFENLPKAQASERHDPEGLHNRRR